MSAETGGHPPMDGIAGRTDTPSAWSKDSFKETFDRSTPVQSKVEQKKANSNYKEISQDQAEMRIAAENAATRDMTVDDVLNDPNNRFKNMSREEAEMRLASLRLDGKDKISISADKKPLTQDENNLNTDVNIPPVVDNQENKSFFSKLKDKFKRDEKPDDSKMNPDQDLAAYKKMQTEGDNYLKEKEQDRQNKLNPVASADSPKVYGTVDPEVQEMRDMNAGVNQYDLQKAEENKPPEFDGKFKGDPMTNFLKMGNKGEDNAYRRAMGQDAVDKRLATADEMKKLEEAEEKSRKAAINLTQTRYQPSTTPVTGMDADERTKISEQKEKIRQENMPRVMEGVRTAEDNRVEDLNRLDNLQPIAQKQEDRNIDVDTSEYDDAKNGILDETITSPDRKQLFVSWSGKDEKYVVRIKDTEGKVNAIPVDSETKVREIQDRFRETGEIPNDINLTSEAA